MESIVLKISANTHNHELKRIKYAQYLISIINVLIRISVLMPAEHKLLNIYT